MQVFSEWKTNTIVAEKTVICNRFNDFVKLLGLGLRVLPPLPGRMGAQLFGVLTQGLVILTPAACGFNTGSCDLNTSSLWF